MSATSLYNLLSKWTNNAALASTEKEDLALQILTTSEGIFLKGKKKKVDKALAFQFLQLSGKSSFLSSLKETSEHLRWSDVVFKAIQLSDYSLNDMFEERVQEIGNQTYFIDMRLEQLFHWTYTQVRLHIREIAAAFYRATKNEPRVAI